MVNRLDTKQFPSHDGHLPGFDGHFNLPPRTSDENPLLPLHTNINQRHRSLLDKIDSFDRMQIVTMMELANQSLQMVTNSSPGPEGASVSAQYPSIMRLNPP